MAQAKQRRPRKQPRGLMTAERGPEHTGQEGLWGAPFAYRARAGQADLHGDPARFKVVVAHRRFGKTVFAVMQLLRSASQMTRRAPRFAYVAPFYRQAKAIVWDYLKQYGRGIEGARFHETELR